ncbi:MAG: hypothetical protein LBK12_01195 [Odoribacteraceae bacterium]|jgi:hypothetical protein|nr:hypothetical protein [Odoribacteraceae bacterium]
MKQLFLSLFCASALFCACSDKDKDDNIDDGVDQLDQASDFIKDNLDAAKQTFQRTVSNDPTVLTLDNGVKLTIPGGNVFTKNGTPITGEYTIEINTMLKPSDVFLSGTNTNYRGGYYLESDGFFHLNVLQNGESVDAITSQFLGISIPTDKANGTWTQIWEGVEVDDQFAWQEAADTVLNNDGRTDKGGVLSYNKNFSFEFKKIGWFNCDVYWSTGTSTTVTVTLTGQVGELAAFQGYTGDTFIFFKAKDSNVMAQLYTKINATTVKSYDNSMPIDTEGTLLAFSIKDGAYSYATKEIKIAADLQETLELQPITKEDILVALKALDK